MSIINCLLFLFSLISSKLSQILQGLLADVASQVNEVKKGVSNRQWSGEGVL